MREAARFAGGDGALPGGLPLIAERGATRHALSRCGRGDRAMSWQGTLFAHSTQKPCAEFLVISAVSEAAPILLGGLRQLEYRGYDSAGVALLHPSGAVEVTRTTNRLGDLESKLGRLNGHARAPRVGIGHTRWATHGRPSEENAHPHTSLDGKIAVVHNGIFENFMTIRGSNCRRTATSPAARRTPSAFRCCCPR